MTIEELMETATDGNQWVKKVWTEEELLEACRYEPRKGQPYEIQRLFSLAKAIHDPSPEVKERQEGMRKKGIAEKDVIAFSALLEEKHFDLPWCCADAIRDALCNLSHGIPSERIGPMESVYEMETY